MPTKRIKQPRREVLASIYELLLLKFSDEPEKFRSILPEIAQIIEVTQPQVRVARSPFGLTEHERNRRLASLLETIRFDRGTLTRERAIVGLEDYAVLLEDDSVPDAFDFEKRIAVFKAAIGKAPGFFKSQITVSVSHEPEAKIVSRMALVRGVTLELSWDMKLLSITISPQRFRERKRALAFVGIGRDPASDVARRHDEYFVETLERGPS